MIISSSAATKLVSGLFRFNCNATQALTVLTWPTVGAKARPPSTDAASEPPRSVRLVAGCGASRCNRASARRHATGNNVG